MAGHRSSVWNQLVRPSDDDEVVPEGVVLPGTPDVVLATSAVDVDAGDSVVFDVGALLCRS